MKPVYPNLVAEMARRDIKGPTIAAAIGISDRALRGKMAGTVDFTWGEARKIHADFFPEIDIDALFTRSDEVERALRRRGPAPAAYPAP